MTDTCQVKMANGKECGRPAVTWTPTNEHCCVCHLQYDGKPSDQFVLELKKILSDKTAEYYDFTGFVFPPKWKCFDIETFDKPVIFVKAIFMGDVEISQKFEKSADFSYSHFNGVTEILADFNWGEFGTCLFLGRVNFHKARFEKDVTFKIDCQDMIYFMSAVFCSKTQFQYSTLKGGADFIDCVFESSVDFRNVHFGLIEPCENIVQFSGTTFMGPADFSEAVFNCRFNFEEAIFCEPKRTSFLEVDLSRTLFNRCDISSVNLDSVQWSRRKRNKFHCNRNKVYDEILLYDRKERHQEAEYLSVAQTYRRLQANYGESYRYPEAGDFYVGEREMVRRSKGKWRFFCLDMFYKLVSNYGESYRRPLGLLAFILFFIPLLLLYSGANVDNDGSTYPHGYNLHEIENWGPDIVQLQPGIIWEDFLLEGAYLDVCMVNLKLLWVNWDKMDLYLRFGWQKTLIIVETLFVASLIALFVLALRRKFKRKSF